MPDLDRENSLMELERSFEAVIAHGDNDVLRISSHKCGKMNEPDVKQINIPKRRASHSPPSRSKGKVVPLSNGPTAFDDIPPSLTPKELSRQGSEAALLASATLLPAGLVMASTLPVRKPSMAVSDSDFYDISEGSEGRQNQEAEEGALVRAEVQACLDLLKNLTVRDAARNRTLSERVKRQDADATATLSRLDSATAPYRVEVAVACLLDSLETETEIVDVREADAGMEAECEARKNRKEAEIIGALRAALKKEIERLRSPLQEEGRDSVEHENDKEAQAVAAALSLKQEEMQAHREKEARQEAAQKAKMEADAKEERQAKEWIEKFEDMLREREKANAKRQADVTATITANVEEARAFEKTNELTVNAARKGGKNADFGSIGGYFRQCLIWNNKAPVVDNEERNDDFDGTASGVKLENSNESTTSTSLGCGTSSRKESRLKAGGDCSIM